MLDKVVSFFIVHAAVVLPLAVVLALVVSSSARAGARIGARLAARLLLIAVVVAIAYDAVRTMSGTSGLVMTSLWEHWMTLSPTTLEAARKAAVTRLGSGVWDMLLAPVLHWPAWMTLGVLALILSWVGRRRREVAIFVN